MIETSIPQPVRGYLERRHLEPARVVPLAGDASDRRYFRVFRDADEPFILAVHAAPFDATALPFVRVAELFAAMPVPVPRVLDTAGDLGVLALDDLGDVTLQSHLASDAAVTHLALYRQAVALIEAVQRRGRELFDPRYPPYGLAFDVEKLMFEMNFFVEHFLVAYRGARLDAAARGALTAEFLTMTTELAAEPRVLCHRDYHSRNLMVRGLDLVIIDFQDARMGPDTYDLVSLLRDSYVDIPDTMVDALIRYFLDISGRLNDEDAFRRRFDLMALQRNLKALGTFGFQATARGNRTYVPYIARTLGYARQNLFKYERFTRLRDELAAVIEEFRA